jgi:CBS domain-containing protein
MSDERVSMCLRRGAITCSEETSLIFVAQIMVVNRIRYCVVINKKHEVVGLISADQMINAYDKEFGRRTAVDIVARDVLVTVTPSTPLREAIDLMAKKKVEHIIVVSDRPGSRAVIGIIAARDIIAGMARDRRKGGHEGLRPDA